jgi:glycerophosphoryl diester phosphodiesterase
MLNCFDNNNQILIAHRGESSDAPENTMAAINLAWARSADAIEIDIQLTFDKKIVVYHDATTQRIGGRNKKVKSQTLAELRELDAGIHKGQKWQGEKIPTLAEVLSSVPPGKKIIIEIKSSAEIIPYLKTEIDKSGLEINQIEMIGFQLSVIAIVKKTMPQFKALWLLDLDYIWFNRIFPPNMNRIISKSKKYKLDGIDVWAGKQLTPGILKKIKTANLLLYTWTVNDPELVKYLLESGVDAVTTDCQWFIKNKLATVSSKKNI